MRVLQIFNRYRERGGEEKSAERIWQHGSEVALIEKLWWDSNAWDEADGPGHLGQLRRIFHNPDTARDLNKSIDCFQPDALLCHNLYPVGSPSIYATAKKRDLPVLQYIHNFRPFSVGATLWVGDRIAEESLKGDFLAEIRAGSWQNSVLRSSIMAGVLKSLRWRGLLDSVSGWIAISEFMRGKFIEAGIAPDKIVTLRHSWDPSPSVRERKEGNYYLFLGRLVPEKGVGTLLDAWGILERELGEACPQLVIGGTGSEEELVRRVAEGSQKIDFVGYQEGEKKAELISGCRAMLAPSIWWEPLGLVTYESYDYCRPMIAAASGGLTETVQDEVTGWLHEPGNAEDLAKVLMQSEGVGAQTRREMGEQGRMWLLQNTSPEEWKANFKDILTHFIK